MKKHLIFAAKLLVILLCGIIAGYALLLAVYALPVEPMAENLRLSIPALNGEWSKEDSYEQLIPGYVTTQLDNSTDAAMLLAAVHENDLPILTRAVEAPRYYGRANAYYTMLDWAAGKDETITSGPIARYWHGYLVVLKPLLMVMSYLDIRMLMMMAQSVLLAAVIAGLCKKNLAKLIAPFLLSLLCVTPSVTGFSLQFSTALYTMLIAMIALLYLPKKWFSLHGQMIFFLLTGMLTSYVDYLTYPLVTFCVPFVVCLFTYPEASAKDEWKRAVLLGVCWIAGYLGMWAGKWVLAGFFGREQWFWPNLMATISTRTSESSGEIELSFLQVLMAVFSPFFKRAYLAAGLAAVIAYACAWLRSRRYPALSGQFTRRVILLGVAVLPFAWFFCTQNHTYNHSFYTSRTLMASAFAAGCLLMTFLRAKRGEN